VALLTSLPPSGLDATAWLKANRQHWGIENGLHARLDLSRNDDRCRLRTPQALGLHSIFTRLANSLFIAWRTHQPQARHLTTTDFTAAMAENHDARALAHVTARHPTFKSLRE
jgi:hypothetical protein